MPRATILAFATLICASSAHAATVDIQAFASAAVFADRVTNQELGGGDTSTSSSFSESTTATVGSTSISSDAFVDGDTGVIRASSTAVGNRGDGLGDGGSVASGEIRETYTLSGSGTLTASIRLSGVWDLSRDRVSPGGPDPVPFWQVQSDVIVDGVRDFVCLGTACGPSINQSNSGSISDFILTASRDFSVNSGTQNAVVAFSLFTQILTANGFIDFGNTAELFVETTGSLIALPSDPDFLSDPVFNNNGGGGDPSPPPSPVPLPASAFLLLGGLAGLLGIRRRKRS